MKTIYINYLIITMAFLGFNTAIAQVGIGTDTPTDNTVLDMQSNTSALESKGLGLPRVDLTNFTDQANTTVAPKDGLMVYNLGNNGLAEGVYTWYNNQWNFNANETETQGSIIPRFLVKLNSDYELFTQDPSNPPLEQVTGFNVIYDILTDYNTFNDTFTVSETGLYKIELNFDYTITDNTIDLPNATSIRPYILYGIYNDTDSEWAYRRYEYLMIDRLTTSTSGQSVVGGGYAQLVPGKTYSIKMNADVMQDNATVTIKATNGGSTGTSDATFLNINKMSGI